MAVASAAALYVVGGSLIGTSVLLPHISSPVGAAAVAVTAFATAAVLIAQVIKDRGGLLLAWAGELWGVVLVLGLCASTGGPSSPFALIYFFAVGHAAAFQPRDRFLLVSVAGLLAYLAPVLYAHVSGRFGAVALVGAVLALLTTGAIHIALERMREQRRRLEFLIAATAKLDTSLDPHQTLRRIAATAVPELAELCVIDLTDASGAIVDAIAAAADPAVASRTEAAHRRTPPDRGSNPIATALITGRATVVNGTPDAHQGVLNGAGRAPGGGSGQLDGEARLTEYGAGYAAAAAVPMVARGRTLGVISFFRGRSFAPGQLELLEDLTGRAALAYDNASLYAERAHVARTLRRSLMPAALPRIAGLELESYFRPMGAGSEVGGDFYDVFGDGESFWLVVGDVCGKGAEAAVLTGFLRHTTVAYAREGAGPADVLVRVNDAMLSHDFEARFATAILARLGFDEAGVRLTVATAGHPAALVVRAGGEVHELGTCGTLLGVFSDPAISETSTVLGPGDAVALYTDGLTEAQAPQRLLTVEQLIAALGVAEVSSAQTAIDALLTLLDAGGGARDDIAILAARVQHGLFSHRTWGVP
jgi:hypothetical protein